MTYSCDEEYIFKKCKEYTLLSDNEIQTIVSVATIMPYISEGFDCEAFVDIKVHNEDTAIVVAETFKKRESIYYNSYMGDTIYRENEPAVFRSFDLGVTTKDLIGVSYDKNKNKIWTRQTVLPIYHHENVVATLILEKVLDLNSDVGTSSLDLNELRNDKVTEIMNLIFGFDLANEELQVHEGILIFSSDGYLKHSNQRAKNIYVELGFKGIENQHFDNINYSPISFDEVISCIGDPFNETDAAHYVLKKCFDGKISIGERFYHFRIVGYRKSDFEIVVFIDDVTKISEYENEVNNFWVTSHEIHHRIKNNLQTVASILRLQSRKYDDKNVKLALNESINRVLCIAATHELLEKKNNNHVSIMELLNKIRDNMIYYEKIMDRDVEIAIQGADFFVDSEQSTVIAAIVNELIQNSLKYAFPQRTDGCITVKTSNDGRIKVLEVKDNGIGYNPDQVKKKGLGLNIVESYVYEKLGGKLFINSSDKGTQTSIAFKL